MQQLGPAARLDLFLHDVSQPGDSHCSLHRLSKMVFPKIEHGLVRVFLCLTQGDVEVGTYRIVKLVGTAIWMQQVGGKLSITGQARNLPATLGESLHRTLG